MTIQHIKQTAVLPQLDAWGCVEAPLSSPSCELHGVAVSIPGCAKTDTGIWECSPGQFRRQIKAGEVMHILTGRCTFTPDGGEPLEIRGGDTLFFEPDTHGVWDIQETVRKVYVLL